MRNYATVVRTLVYTLSIACAVSVWTSPRFERSPDEFVSAFYNAVLWGSLLLPDADAREGLMQKVYIYGGCTVLGVGIGITSHSATDFGTFLVFFSVFHLLEFALTTLSHPPRFQSMLLNHGREYAGAFTSATLEHFLSPILLPPAMQRIGVLMATVGLIIRGTSLLTAGEAFTHIISTKRRNTHTLVTTGIYRYMRHPGYCGWLLWVAGSQLLAANPVCTVLFTAVTWIFFTERIEYEESLLESMFGVEYDQYRLRTPFSGVPFIP